MKVGDKVYCKKSFVYDISYNRFNNYSYTTELSKTTHIKGKWYTIYHIGETEIYVYSEKDSKSNLLGYMNFGKERHDGKYHPDYFYDYFYTKQEVRKIKLKTLKN